MTPEESRSQRRRDFALGIVALGGLMMTILVYWTVWFMMDANAVYLFNIAIGALINIAIIFTGILGLLVKRRLSVSKTEMSVSDFENENKQS